MIFYFILKHNGFNWIKAKEIFYSLTEDQVMWIAEMIKREGREASRAMRPTGRYEEVKSFRLR